LPGFRAKLNDKQIAQLATFLRASWGNSGTSVSDAAVAKQR
jgi:alcohol dehydrogenase (quinone), cytochrome c subunit